MKSFRFFPLLFLGITTIAQNISTGLPIKPTRTISFTTDEGSYMDVDVSPDGKMLVFDLLGDLYMVPSSGGKAKQLTRGIALHLRPIWSPDGKRIAYIGDGSGDFRLHVIDTGRTFHYVLGGSRKPPLHYNTDYQWTPDGNHLVCDESIYGLTGGQSLTDSNAKAAIRFSTDGRKVYTFESERIYCYDRVSGIKMAISGKLARYPREAMLSPNARWWTYITDSSNQRCLIVVDLITNMKRILVSSLILDNPKYNRLSPLPHYSISSDSKNIFISYGGKIHRIELESCKDEIVPFSAKVNVDLGPYNYNTNSIGNDSIKVRYIRWARTSPDGKQLAFSALDRIYVVDLPAGKPRVLANQAANQFQPVYSSDSRWIAYVSWADTIGGYIWRVPSKGGLPERLANIPGRYFCPTWSPNGKWIAVLWEKPKIGNRDDLGLARLELVPADGGPIRTIDDSIPMLNNLCFSANGERIMYNPKRSIFRKLKAELISRDLNGLNQEIIAVGTDPTFFSAKEVSPDGRYIVYSNMENLYLATVSKGTGPTSLSDEDRRLSVVRFAAGIDPHWEKDGKVIAWNYGNRFYRISPEKIMDAVERLGQNGLLVDSPGRYFRTVSVLPEEVIDVPMTIPASYAQGMIALKNARIITMRKEKVIERGTVLVEDGRIVAVGPVASITIPAGTKSLNFSGTTIMPGLIDLHLHLHLAPDVLPEQSWVLLASLAYGVTTVRDPSLNYESYGYAELLKSGKMIGPRLYTVGRPVRFGDGIPRLDNLEDARAVVRNRLELGSIVVKNYLPAALRLKREWLAIACREAGLNMTNEGWNDPILAWGMIKDGSAGLEHNPFWGDVYKDIISIFVRSGIWFTPTIQVSESLERGLVYFNHKYWREPDAKLQRFTIATDSMTYEGSENETVAKIMNARPSDTSNPGFIASARIDARIRHAGGHVTLGSHGNDVGIGAHNELWALQLGGLTNMEALQAGTIMGAEALGVQKDLGSLEVGKIADLIILNKNPLDDIHNSREIRYVMKDGILYDANTLDENWPEKKKCPEWRMPEDRQPASQASLPTPPKTGSARD